MIKCSKNIVDLAEYIALQYESIETPLENILEDEGLRVIYDDYENAFDGLTTYCNGKFNIHLNTARNNYNNSARGRFTLAHELGHYFIDNHRIALQRGLINIHPSITSHINYDRLEKEADCFASCLLMPEKRFREMIISLNINSCSELINTLKNNFGVSFTACALRFADIGNREILVVYAENNIIKWCYKSEDFPYYFQSNSKVPSYTVMGEYYAGKGEDYIKRDEKINAIDCFPYLRKEDQNSCFYEYCIANKNKALSIIWRD